MFTHGLVRGQSKGLRKLISINFLVVRIKIFWVGLVQIRLLLSIGYRTYNDDLLR